MRDQRIPNDLDLPILGEIGDALYRATVAIEAADANEVRSRPARWSRRRAAAGAALLATSATAGGIALAGGFGGGSSVTPDQFVSGSRPVAPSVITPDQSMQLGILRRARAPSDTVPSELAAGLSQAPGGGSNGPNFALSRRVQGLTTGEAWIVPGANSVCLIAQSTTDTKGAPLPRPLGGATCVPEATVAAGRTVLTSGSASDPGILFLAGIVPDGVSTVAVNVTGGPDVSVEVHDNTYVADITGSPTSASFSGPAGQTTIPLAVIAHHPYITGRGKVVKGAPRSN